MTKTALKYYISVGIWLLKNESRLFTDNYVNENKYAHRHMYKWCLLYKSISRISSATFICMYAIPFLPSFLKSIPWFQNSNVLYGKLVTTCSNRLKFMPFLSAISLLQVKLKGNDPWNTTLGGYGNPFNCTLLPTVTISRYYLPITLIAISLDLLYFHTYKLHLR